MTATADWDDADAAVYGSAEKVDAAVVRVVVVSDTLHQYHLRRTTGERGILNIQREMTAKDPAGRADPKKPASLTMTCSLGRIGDPAREQKLMDAVAARLAKLRGVDWAPLE